MQKIKFISIISFILISILWLSGCECNSCGSNEKEEDNNTNLPCEHDWIVESIIDATCSVDGKTIYKCG